VCVCMQQSSRPSAHDLAPVGHLDTVVISRPGPRITAAAAAAAAGGGGGVGVTGGQLGGSAASQRRRQPSLGRTLRLQETSTRRLRSAYTHTHTRTRAFSGPLSGTTRLSQYHKGKTNLDFTEARDSEWQWHQLGHM